MTATDWAGLILTLIGILSAITVAARWIIRHYLKDVLHELKPNGGSSIKDQVNRLESDVKDLKKQNETGEIFHERLDNKLDKLTEMLISYISKQ